MDGDLVSDLDLAGTVGADVLGVKGWYLAQLRARGFPVPPGFVITTHCYRQTTRRGGVSDRLDRIWRAARHADPGRIQQLARTARHLIAELRIAPPQLREIARMVDGLGDGVELAVRASVTAEAVTGPQCAGVHTTYTNVVGVEQVISRVQHCWASLFSERALTMRARGLGGDDPAMAVVVQPMVPADASGTALPFGGDGDVLVEATFGLGEPIVSGAVEPDRYVVDMVAESVRSVTVGRKQIMLAADAHGRHAFVAPAQQRARVLGDDELYEIGRLCRRVTASFGADHEIEWVTDATGPVLLQARAITSTVDDRRPTVAGVVRGTGVGLGAVTGTVHIVRCAADLDGVDRGDVVVTAETLPEWQAHLRRAGALVTDTGDVHSHAARLARECGLPAVVGTGTATTDLREGAAVTVDALHGWIMPASVR